MQPHRLRQSHRTTPRHLPPTRTASGVAPRHLSTARLRCNTPGCVQVSGAGFATGMRPLRQPRHSRRPPPPVPQATRSRRDGPQQPHPRSRALRPLPWTGNSPPPTRPPVGHTLTIRSNLETGTSARPENVTSADRSLHQESHSPTVRSRQEPMGADNHERAYQSEPLVRLPFVATGFRRIVKTCGANLGHFEQLLAYFQPLSDHFGGSHG